MERENKAYRPNVAVFVINDEGDLLICERPAGRTYEGKDLLQTVQGGIDGGETAEAAMEREVCEEIGLTKNVYTVVKKLEERIRYDWPEDYIARTESEFVGQEQTFFLIHVPHETHFVVDGTHGEFSRVWWGSAEELLRGT